VTERPPRAAAQDFVRPFVITGGRTRAADASLKVETMVQSVDRPLTNLSFEAARIVDLCYEPISIAEIASELGIPLGVAIVVVGDLVNENCLEPSCNDPVEIELSTLTRMIERVRAL